MLSVRVRPRIKKYTNYSVEEVLDCFTQTLNSSKFKLDGTILKNHVFVKIPDEIHHYWSPELQLEISENSMKDDKYAGHDENTMIRGFVGPKSTLWTMFIFFYIVFGVLTLFGTVLGSSQQMLDISPEGYWYAIPGGLGLLLTFLTAQIGQKMGEEQTHVLLSYVEKALENCE